MGSAGDLERCMMYTAVGALIVLPDDSIFDSIHGGAYQNVWDEQFVLIQFARRRRDPNVGDSS